jgi:hypothetical protein
MYGKWKFNKKIMKKTSIIALFLLGLTSVCYAQFTGGGETSQPSSQVVAEKEKPEKDDSPFRRTFYIRGGSASARGTLGELPQAGKSLLAPFQNEDGMGMTRGYTFELGFFSYFHGLDLQEQFKVGLNTSFEGSLLVPDWSHLSEDWQDRSVAPFLIGSFGLGPAISYNPIDQLVIDAYFQVRLAVNAHLDSWPVYGRSVQAENPSGYELSSSFRISTDSPVSLRSRQVLGFNVRYATLILGLGFQFGSGNFSYDAVYETYDAYSYEYVDHTSDVLDQRQFDSSLKLGTTQLTIGFIF